MYCKHCGKKIPEKSKFCRYCGNKLSTKEELVVKPTASKDEAPEGDYKDKLTKRYKDTGNTAIALSVLGLILSFIISLADYTFAETVIGAIISLPFLAPFYYFGKKLKEEGIKNLEYASKVSKGMLIYTAVFIVVNIMLGQVGWLWILLLYYFYKSYKETKKLMGNMVNPYL